MRVVSIEDFGDAIIDIIGDAIYKKEQAVNALLEEAAPKVLKAVKDNSPTREGGGKYKKGWRLKKSETLEGKKKYVIHNSKHGGLTHILEDGTVQRKTKKGANRGSVDPNNIEVVKNPHIRSAALPLLEEFKQKLKKI